MEKMKKTAKGLDTVFKIVQGILWVAGAFILLAAVALPVSYLTGDREITLIESIELGKVAFTLAPEYTVNAGLGYYIAVMVLTPVLVGLMSVWLGTIRKILKPMGAGLPFHDSIGGNLKKLGWLELAIGMVMSGMDFARYLMFVLNVDLAALFVSEKITAVNVGYEFDMSFLVTAAVFFLASYIFRYGAQLQQMSDETL